MRIFKKSKIERIYHKLDKKFNRIYNLSGRFNGSIMQFTWDPYLGLLDKKGNEIIIILRKKNCFDELSKQLNDLLWKIKRKEESEK